MKPKMLIVSILIAVITLITFCFAFQKRDTISFRHLSTVNGDLPIPNDGKQQTSSIVCDIDKDGINDFVITEL